MRVPQGAEDAAGAGVARVLGEPGVPRATLRQKKHFLMQKQHLNINWRQKRSVLSPNLHSFQISYDFIQNFNICRQPLD